MTDIPCPANALRIENCPCPVPICAGYEEGAVYGAAHGEADGGGAAGGGKDGAGGDCSDELGDE